MISRLLRFARNRRGTSAIEFAILGPAFITLWCGVVEVTNLLTADRKVIAAADSAADLVAQETTIDDTKINDIFSATQLILTPFPSSGLLLSVTSVVFDVNTGAPSIDWQKVSGGTPAGGSVTADVAGLGAKGESVIVIRASYSYTPIVGGFIFSSPMTLSQESFARPRKTQVITCTATGC